jgi:transposase
MKRQAKPGEIERLKQLLKERKKAEETKRIQCVLLCLEKGMGPSAIAEIVGFRAASVGRILRRYWKRGESSLENKPRGGRWNQNMTVEEEKEFLGEMSEQAARGEITSVKQVQAAYEKAIGKPTGSSTVHDLLKRHNWRLVTPRPKHPKASARAREKFKKKTSSEY